MNLSDRGLKQSCKDTLKTVYTVHGTSQFSGCSVSPARGSIMGLLNRGYIRRVDRGIYQITKTGISYIKRYG